jgi:hypothetical protein
MADRLAIACVKPAIFEPESFIVSQPPPVFENPQFPEAS